MPSKRKSEFLTEQQIVKLIQMKLSGGSSLSAAVAFWGSGAAEKLNIHHKNAHLVEIVCNLRMGGTNPNEIIELQRRGVKTKHRDDLHAKVYIFDDSAIIGSSNASSNGLAFQEGEGVSWREANIFITDRRIVSEMKAWFADINNSASPVLSKDLKIAGDAWSKRRSRNPIRARNLYEAASTNPKTLEGHQIYISITSEEASGDAEKAVEKHRKTASFDDASRISYYENWRNIPEDIVIIDFFGDCKNGVEFQGIYQTPAQRISIPHKRGSIQICYECKSINGLALGNKTAWERAVHKAVKDKKTFISLSEFATKFID